MAPARFQMNLSNPSLPRVQQQMLAQVNPNNSGIRPAGPAATVLGLNYPMIGRMANTRNGCSACGK